MSTPLHAALGRVDDVLSVELVEQACAERVPETENLDFKRDLPLPLESPSGAEEQAHSLAKSLELAKDLAAMANGRGGLVVYGVRDEDDAAAELVGVDAADAGLIQMRIRQVAYNFIYPPVRVECVLLRGQKKSVLVLEVAESADAPHLVRPKRAGGNEGWLVAPYRAGPHTFDMVEKELESAYRRRFEGRRREQQELRDLHAELGRRHVGRLDQETTTVLAVARPTRPPLQRFDHRELEQRIRSTVHGAGTWAVEWHRQLHSPDRDVPFALRCFAESKEARRGLRRYVFTPSREVLEAKLSGCEGYVGIEVHDNGAFGLVWRRGQSGSLPGGGTNYMVPKTSLGETDMDAVTLMLLSLMIEIREDLGVDSDYQVRLSVVPEALLSLLPEEGRLGAAGFETVEAPPVVEAEVRLSGSPDLRARDLLTLGRDLSNLIGRSESVLERFWYGNGTDEEHPVRRTARRIFGGLPNHPESGYPL